jgi:serine/threonine protein kinase
MKSQIGNFGLPLNPAIFKGLVSPDFQYPSLIKKISAPGLLFQDPRCQMLHDGRSRRAKLPFSLDKGQTICVFVKEFNVKGIDKLKTLFFSSKAAKAWRGSLILVKKDILTPEPVAYLEGKRAPFIRQSFYFSLFVRGAEEIRHLLRQLPDEELKRLLESLARYLSCCHDKRILHRDLSDGNILVRKNANQEYRFFLIDTNRVRLKRRMSTLQRVKNLIRLGIPPPLQRFFLEEYLGPAQLRYIDWIWYKFNKNLYTGYVHLKRKLRIRQLIQRLGIQ